MKIQLSDKRIVKNVMTIWSHEGPEVDLVMDLKNLTFRPGSIEEIYAFHVLDNLFPDEGEQALRNWNRLLRTNGKLHVLNDDFEYVNRAFLGGDIDIEVFNNLHNHPCQCTQKSVVDALARAGFNENNVVIWYISKPDSIEKKHYEFMLTGNKNG